MLNTVFLVTLIAGIAITALCALSGFFKGVFRSLLRLAVFAVCAVISVIAANAVSPTVSNILVDYIKGIEAYQQFASMAPSLTPFITAIVGAIAAPFLFAVCLCVIGLLSKIGFKAWSTAIVKEKGKDLVGRLAGIGVGILYGLIASILVFLPVNNLLDITSDIEPEALEALPIANLDLSVEGNFVMSFSGDVACALMSDKEVNGSEFNANNEIPVIISAGLKVFDEYSKNSDAGLLAVVQASRTALPYIDKSPALATILSEIISVTASELNNGGSIFGISLGAANDIPYIKAIINPLLASLENTTAENAVSNIETLGNVAEIIGTVAESSEGGASLDNLVTEDGKVSAEAADMLVNLTETIADNEDFEEVVAEIGNMGRELMADVNPFEEETLEIYEDVLVELNNVIDTTQQQTHSEKVETIQTKVLEVADEYKLEIDDASAKVLSVFIVAEFGKQEQVDLKDLMVYSGVDPAKVDEFLASKGQ